MVFQMWLKIVKCVLKLEKTPHQLDMLIAFCTGHNNYFLAKILKKIFPLCRGIEPRSPA